MELEKCIKMSSVKQGSKRKRTEIIFYKATNCANRILIC